MTENIELIDQIKVNNIKEEPINLTNSGGILTLGILSIVLCGLVGLILGIISLSMASTALQEYKSNPEKYTESSYKNVKAGKTCSIIGISLLGFIIFMILIIAIAANL